MSGRGTSRVLEKLERSVQDGNYYEAHQMYRTLYFRYNTQQKYDEAISLLFNGSLMLLNVDQLASGADLALLLLDTLEKSDVPVNSEMVEKVSKLHRLMEPESPERQNYTSIALRWAQQGSPTPSMIYSSLHRQFALTFWHERNYIQAQYHFLHSTDGEGCATMLVEHHVTSGYSSEVDLFLAQAVLQFLCLGKKPSAERCFNTYTTKHPQVEKGPPFIRPLLNFLSFLLLAVEGQKLAVYTVLCEEYQPSLSRDPNYNEYLDKIGQVFFGLPKPRTSNNAGFFGNFLQNWLDEDPEEEDAAQGTGVAAATVELD